mgnify:CR=1 FL=1
MSRKAKFTPEEKEQAVIDYLEGNKSRIQICGELCISSRTIQDWALRYNKHGLAGFSKKMRKCLQVQKKSLPLHPRSRKTDVLTKTESLQ